MSSSSSNYEYHYRHRVTVERDLPPPPPPTTTTSYYISPPPPLEPLLFPSLLPSKLTSLLPALPAPPPPPPASRVVYVEVEKPQPPPPKKRVVFIEVEKPPTPPPPPVRERVVLVRVENPALTWPLRPSYSDVWGIQRPASGEKKKIDLSTEMSSVEISLSTSSSSSDVGQKLPKITGCRFAERTDLRKIGRLVKCRTLSLFPEAENPVALYDKSCLPLVQQNELDEIVSAMFVCDHPNVPAVSQSAWPTWLDKLYDVKNASAANTLFVHMVAWDERYEADCPLLQDLLTATFYAVARCDYVVLVLPPTTVEPARAIGESMTRVAPKSESPEVRAQVLYVGERGRFVPQLKFRMAVEEDNDDVVGMLDSDTTLLREFYGDFYPSELARHPDPWRRVVIGDTDNRMACVACLNERVDLELLNDRFELNAFDNLMKRTVKFAPSSDDESEDEEDECEDYESREYNSDADNETREDINTNDAGVDFTNAYSDESGEEEYPSVPSTRGDAFALELLGFRCGEPLLLASSREILVAAFECFPRLRYCLALMPTDRQHFPFLDHFTRVPLKADRDFPMALYVAHRAAIHGSFKVREVRKEDHEAVYRLLLRSENILDDFNEASKDDGSRRGRCYLFACDNVVAGLAIVRDESAREVDRLCGYYRVEDLVERRRGDALRLLGLALAPIFQASTGFFLGEIMRLEAKRPLLFYRSTTLEDAPLCVSASMQAVEPRIRNWPQFQRYFDEQHDDDSPYEELFSLHLASPRSIAQIAQIVNVKIVVVGASDCGLAFVDALASGYKCRELRFADITLISTNGLPYEHSGDRSIRTMTPFRGRYCDAYRRLTSGRMNYNVVKGTVVEIDRKKRQVYVEDSGALSYDYLVLTCGLLFQRPEFSEDFNPDKDGMPEVPPNLFSINDDVDAAKCARCLKKLTKNFRVQKSIVFHGCNVECYCALAALLESGLEGSWIMLIEPMPRSDDIFHGDPEIRDHLRETITSLGVTLHSGYDIAELKLNESTSRIESVALLRENDDDDDAEGPRELLVPCDALLGFHAKSPCLKTFLAISRAGLVFDGRLVIDAEFRTNDRRVFAAGTMTKYSRRLRAEDREHKYFDSLQVGEKLAEKFVSIITTADDGNEAASEKFKAQSTTTAQLPEFQAPIIVSCLLPGGYRYLHVRKPGPRPPPHGDNDRASRDDATVLSTGSCTADTGYFRLRLNQFRALECVTCCSETDFDIQSVIALYGKHEALFDDLKTRFSNDEIPDLYAYFREPWASALFADDFDERCLRRKQPDYGAISSDVELRESLFHELLYAIKSADDKKAAAEELSNRLLTNDDEEEENVYSEEMRERLIEYLERREDELPMYSTPERRRRILDEIADNPLLSGDCDDIVGTSSSPECSCVTETTTSIGDTHVLESGSSDSCRCSGCDCDCDAGEEIVLT